MFALPTPRLLRGAPWRWGAPLAFLGLAACGQAELLGSPDGSGPGGPGPEHPGDLPSVPLPAECGTSASAGPAQLRRLSNEEYLRSARDLLYLTDAEVQEVAPLLVVEAPSNISTGLTLSASHLRRYLAAAERLAQMALSTPERRQKLAGCELTEASCRVGFAGWMTRLFYRYPPIGAVSAGVRTASEVAVTSADPDPYRAGRLILESLLISPGFLFRVENPTQDDPSGLKKLSDYEVATRLSYLIWGTTPDTDLVVGKAFSSQLSSVEQVGETARAMLADPRAREGVGRFLGRWLGVDELSRQVRSEQTYPEWTDELKHSMQGEMERLVNDFWVEPGSSFLGLLSAKYTYVDASLAPIYGLPSEGSGFSRVSFPEGSPRSGLLTQPGFLASGVSGSELVAPILQGKALRSRFLCGLPLPPPPPEVPVLPADPTLTVRERLAQHRNNAACEACHRLLDPLGLGLEQFDLIGRYRTQGSQGEPLSGQGQLFGIPGDPVFTGAAELAALLEGSDELSTCVARQAVRYAYGRELEGADACAVAQAKEAFRSSGGDLKEVLVVMAMSDSFRFASVPGGAP
jgi:hypothetical protein